MTIDLKPLKNASLLTDAENQENYRSLFSSMAEGVGLYELIYDSAGKAIDYKYLDVNPAFERLSGLSKQEVIGRMYNECVPEDNPIWLERFSEVVRSGVSERF